MKSHTTTTLPLSPRSEENAPMAKSERGRRFILAGWIVTMLGIVCYIVAMSRAGESATILDAFMNQGLLGWSSAVLILGGVATWFVGNVTCLHDMASVADDEG